MKHERCVTWLLSVKFLYSALESICSCYSSQHVLVVVHLRISQLINTCSHTLTLGGCRIAKNQFTPSPCQSAVSESDTIDQPQPPASGRIFLRPTLYI